MTALASVAGVGSVTQIKRGLKTLLLGDAFISELVALDAAFADGLVTPPLQRVSTAERRVQPAEMPYAELLGVQAMPLSDSAWSQAREHAIAIRFAIAGSDEELITMQAERYVLAARRLFSLEPGDEHRLFPYVGGVTVPDREDYDPIAQVQTDLLVKFATLELFVRTLR